MTSVHLSCRWLIGIPRASGQDVHATKVGVSNPIPWGWVESLLIKYINGAEWEGKEEMLSGVI